MTNETTRVVVKGIGRHDGEYELDTDRAYNAREWRWIKQISGYMPLTVDEGFRGSDPSLVIALTVIAMARSHKIEHDQALEVADQLSEAPFDGATIQIIGPELEEEELPLASPSRPDDQSSNGTDSRPSGTQPAPNSSGKTSSPSSGQLDATPEPTGTTGSDTSRTSAPERLGI